MEPRSFWQKRVVCFISDRFVPSASSQLYLFLCSVPVSKDQPSQISFTDAFASLSLPALNPSSWSLLWTPDRASSFPPIPQSDLFLSLPFCLTCFFPYIGVPPFYCAQSYHLPHFTDSSDPSALRLFINLLCTLYDRSYAGVLLGLFFLLSRMFDQQIKSCENNVPSWRSPGLLHIPICVEPSANLTK